MSLPSLHAVIMAGGSGTRFWPASRADRPKQFLPISAARSMIAETYARLEGLVSPERVLVVTAEGQAELVRECLPALPPENLLAEPEARNTSACIALASFEVERRDPLAVQLVLAADHVIEPVQDFRATVRAAARAAADGAHLITLGVRPDHPATGYGYLKVGDQVDTVEGQPVFEVSRFVEKPDRATAESFLRAGRFYWNSGMFVWRTDAILDAFLRLMPEVHAGLRDAPTRAALAAAYRGLPSVPVDKGIMERASNVRMLPIDYRWNDVGSWSALTGVLARDAAGNWPALSGGARLIAEDAEGCVAYAEGPELIALLGVRDLVVVRSGNATLVAPRERAEEVKRLVERLRAEGPEFV
jgi:mannose-1-phosphate guanylyltransferase